MIRNIWLENAPPFSAKATEEQRLEFMMLFLTEGHLETFGGYPHDAMWIDSTLIVADLDSTKDRKRTELLTYEKTELLAWYERALKLAESGTSDWAADSDDVYMMLLETDES